MTSFNVTIQVFPTAQDEDELFSDIPKEGDYLEKYFKEETFTRAQWISSLYIVCFSVQGYYFVPYSLINPELPHKQMLKIQLLKVV